MRKIGNTNSKDLVSIIIPAYNVEQHIGNTIQSLLNQEYGNIEIIIVNDGSSDNTLSVIESYKQIDSRIIVLSQPNGGAARARNAGLSAATGDYITFLDGDDMLHSDTISENLKYLSANENLDWVSFPIVRVDANDKPIEIKNAYQDLSRSKLEFITAEDYIPRLIRGDLSGVCCGAIYRKKSIEKIRFPEGEYYEDSFFFTRLLYHTNNGCLSPYGSYRYVHREGSSQLQTKDFKRLQSATKCELERLRLFRDRFPQFEDYYNQIELGLICTLSTAVAKGIPDCFILLDFAKSEIKFNPSIPAKIKLKNLVYRIFGYQNLVRLYKLIGK